MQKLVKKCVNYIKIDKYKIILIKNLLMLFEDYCSLISTLIFNVVYIPQIYRVIKLKDSASLSLYYLLLIMTSMCFYIYFVYKKDLKIQFYGTIIQFMYLIILVYFKIKHTYYPVIEENTIPVYIIQQNPNSDQEALSS